MCICYVQIGEKNENPNFFDTKKAKRILDGRGQKTTWGRIVPTSIYVHGRQIRSIEHLIAGIPEALKEPFEEDTLFEFKRTGEVRRCP